MKKYLRNIWLKIALVLVVFGWGPLWVIVLLAAIGLWPDSNPNPIGPGFLFFFTFWPAVICVGIGVFQVRRRRHSGFARRLLNNRAGNAALFILPVSV